ncbi:MAG: class I SAM-dependent methyltransferase [Candidatus Electrothrix sp. AR3]|nr:class I SAM-dependent methyltransferase [Candidatus Electrothrix sp. AR3]
MNKEEWEKRYDDHDLPWDSGQPDPRLMALLANWPRFSGKILEIGCGTGTNAVWLAEQGFQVTALDISSSAVAMAQQRSAKKGVECSFVAADFLTCSLGEEPFSLIFDRGCFHSMAGMEERRNFVQQAASYLAPGGLWFSLIGNKDQVIPEGAVGPPRLSAAEICAVVEPAFEILRLESLFSYSPNQPAPLRFWQCLMRLRD